MNIAAVMAALEVDDLDAAAKHAVVMVACRADRYTGAALVSVGRVARDMHCHPETARRALQRAVDAGYLLVEKSVGKPSLWRLDPQRFAAPPPAPDRDTSRPWVATKDVEGESQGGGAAVDPHIVDPHIAARTRAAIAACAHCDEFGWLWRDGIIVGRCTHRTVTDLTIDELLGVPVDG